MRRSIEQILKDVEARGVTSDIITELIAYHADDAARMYGLHQRYIGSSDGVPVLSRVFEDENKINNKIANDFFGEIVDTKVGYFAGMPIGYEVHRDAQNHDAVREKIWLFRDRNHIPDMDAETAKMAAICGVGVRLLYIDTDGEEAALNVHPWEVVFVTDGPVHSSGYAMRYYRIMTDGGEKWRVDWYDDTTVTRYLETDAGVYSLQEQVPHMFDVCPLIGFANNEEQQGDCEKVLALIDGYDNTISDVNSEIEQFRLAYMAFYGYTPDAETIAMAKQTGAFGLDEDGKIEFITKQMQDGAIENHLNRLEKNIYRFSKTPNFSDEAFAGSQSGEARKYKMLPFENKCVVAERKFSAALRRQMQVLSTAWVKKGLSFAYTDVDFIFKRNFPLDLRYEAETTALLRGHVSEKTRIGRLSFVANAEDEIAEMQAESGAYAGVLEDDDETGE